MTVCAVYTGTRAPDDPPEGLRLRHVPLLAARPVDIDEQRIAELAAEPAALLVYSRNAVRALAESGAERLLGELDRHLWWAVGRKTAEALAERFDVDARVPDRQNFEGLREALADAELPDRVVALSLEGTHRDIEPARADRSIAFEDVSVYRTGPVDYSPPFDPFRAADWLMFASPRAVEVFAELDRAHDPGPHAEHTRIAAIGPTTAAALRDNELAPDYVPDEPSLDAMMAAIASSNAD